MYPDPDPQSLINPDPVRIQVHKITKFSKHLLIFKSQVMHQLPKTIAPTFLGSDLKNLISCEKKKILLVKLRFSLLFIDDFIPLDPDPDSESGSTSLVNWNQDGRSPKQSRITFSFK